MPNNFAQLVDIFVYLLSLTIPIIFALTLIVIIFKIIDAWLINPGDESKVKEGTQTALIGVVALFFMSAVWGILQLLRDSLFY